MADKQLKLTAVDIKKALAIKHEKDIFVCECKTGPTQRSSTLRIMDAVAIKKSWIHPIVTAYEIKVSMADFKADDKWPGYLEFCDCFYFICPKDLISTQDIAAISQHHQGVGLIHVNGNGDCRTIIKALNRNLPYNADLLMYILMSRVGSDRYPFHDWQIDYFREWLEQKKNNHAIGQVLGTRLGQLVRDQQKQIEDLKEQLCKKQDRADVNLTNLVNEMGGWDANSLCKIVKQFKSAHELIYLIQAVQHLTEIIEAKKLKDSKESQVDHG